MFIYLGASFKDSDNLVILFGKTRVLNFFSFPRFGVDQYKYCIFSWGSILVWFQLNMVECSYI